MKCPICKSINARRSLEIPSASIIGSHIYGDIIVMECPECGHVFNYLNEQDTDNLPIYYKREYEEGRFTHTGVKSEFLDEEYDNNYAIITQENIGSYIDLLIQLNNDKFNELWPARNFIALDQFLEHCWNLDAIMQYIRQTLPRGGHVYVSVPDYDMYDTWYYYLIKEHIQHFTRDSIEKLFEKYGFTVYKMGFSTLDILGGALKMPILEYIFINNKPKENDGVYCYGAGRELLYMLDNNEYFINNPIDGIIDDTPFKCNKKINGIPIYSSDKVKELSPQSTIIITAYYSREKVKNRLIDMQYKGQIKMPDVRWGI